MLCLCCSVLQFQSQAGRIVAIGVRIYYSIFIDFFQFLLYFIIHRDSFIQ